MNAALPALLCAGLVLGGCARIAGSGLNPFNWFGPSTSVAAAAPGEPVRPLVTGGVQVVDARPLVGTVTGMRVDRTPSGVIVVAEGVVPTQGYFNAELVRGGVRDGVLILAFRAEAPQVATATGTVASRTITAALDLDASDIAGVRTIRVEGQSNARTAAR